MPSGLVQPRGFAKAASVHLASSQPRRIDRRMAHTRPSCVPATALSCSNQFKIISDYVKQISYSLTPFFQFGACLEFGYVGKYL
jgi:hypothetical protein